MAYKYGVVGYTNIWKSNGCTRNDKQIEEMPYKLGLVSKQGAF